MLYFIHQSFLFPKAGIAQENKDKTYDIITVT